ncbi:hypothetical protein [Candidatus Sneabacter namystus]|uniref:Outer membrane beta-barrel protein n=1 Tax=Candidatus Sneabacter namystus TaxID=2601646 RepID=A0A5C0UIX2_9RICK|nr:hypothetical protein [Candidatus Sneabacter namystus]QEK39392.1 hypothetical protein FZC37_00325 [Candidatus Sneabacter namystus]
MSNKKKIMAAALIAASSACVSAKDDAFSFGLGVDYTVPVDTWGSARHSQCSYRSVNNLPGINTTNVKLLRSKHDRVGMFSITPRIAYGINDTTKLGIQFSFRPEGLRNDYPIQRNVANEDTVKGLDTSKMIKDVVKAFDTGVAAAGGGHGKVETVCLDAIKALHKADLDKFSTMSPGDKVKLSDSAKVTEDVIESIADRRGVASDELKKAIAKVASMVDSCEVLAHDADCVKDIKDLITVAEVAGASKEAKVLQDALRKPVDIIMEEKIVPHTGLLTGEFKFYDGDPMSVSLLAGLGMTHWSRSHTYHDNSDRSDVEHAFKDDNSRYSRDFTFSGKLGLGFSFNVSDVVNLNLSASYQYLGEPEFAYEKSKTSDKDASDRRNSGNRTSSYSSRDLGGHFFSVGLDLSKEF